MKRRVNERKKKTLINNRTDCHLICGTLELMRSMSRPTITFGVLAFMVLILLFMTSKTSRLLKGHGFARSIDEYGSGDVNNELKGLLKDLSTSIERLDTRIEKLETLISNQENSNEDEEDDGDMLSSSSVNEDNNRRPKVQFLTRMSRRGLDLMDNWRPLNFQFTEEQIKQMYEAFGTDDPSFNIQTCTTSRPGRAPVAVRLAYHGLGMNLLQLTNYIIWASYNNKFIMFIRMLEYNEKHGGLGSHAFQNWFEMKFTLANKDDSTCDIYGTLCQSLRDHCYDGFWNNTNSNPKADLWAQATGFMGSYRSKNLALHDAYKTQIIREVLRMTFEARKTLDENQREAIKPVRELYKKDSVFKIAVHVRRTDKITGESVKIGAEIFGVALENIIQEKLRVFKSYKSVLIFVISDERDIEDEWNDRVLTMPWFKQQRKKITHFFRIMNNRPDRTSDWSAVDTGFYELLIDLRLMIDAHAFLGSQSSNLGVVTCYLRVHDNCFNVEKDSLEWNPAESKIA